VGSTVKVIMRSTKRIRLLLIFIGLPFVLLVGVWMQSAYADEQKVNVVIIGNKNIPESSLSKVDIQNIFLGKKTRLASIKITFGILKESPVHESFLQEYLSRTPAQYEQYWKKLIFTGQGKAPKVFETEEALVEYVKNTAGAIGYIGSNTAQSIESDGLHQFTIQ
jgi:ABC-type phosphate transport system substrate-binding protein